MSSPTAAPTPRSPLRSSTTLKRACTRSRPIFNNTGYPYDCESRGHGESPPSAMLIPSIDLRDGAVVQLVQGETLAITDADVFRWVRRFARFPKVQVIDLDAA